MKTSHMIIGGAAIVGALALLYVYRQRLGFQPPSQAVGPNSLVGDNAPGAAAQLAGKSLSGRNYGTVPTFLQQVQQYGQSSPNGTLQTVGNSVAVANQGLGLYANIRDVYPELGFSSAGDASNVDPSALAGNPTENYDAGSSLSITDQNFADSYSAA